MRRLVHHRPVRPATFAPPMAAAPDSTDAAAQLWSAISEELRQTLAPPTYSAWFGRASGRALTAEAIEVEVPNEFVRGWISGHFMDLVTAAAEQAHGGPLAVDLVLGAVEEPAPEPEVVAAPVPVPPAVTAPRPIGLNRNATFETFVIGPSNRFAHAAALAEIGRAHV